MDDWLRVACDTIRSEAEIVEDVCVCFLSPQFREVVEAIAVARGNVVLSGVGKSGLVARRGAAILTSLGISSHFVHPTDAVHGDCGFIRSGDVFIGLSHSGETDELIHLVRHVRDRVYTIGITSRLDSSLSELVDTPLTYPARPDGGVHGFLPTVSCAAQTAYLDGLAVAVATIKKVDPAAFKLHHPGGSLGKTLT